MCIYNPSPSVFCSCLALLSHLSLCMGWGMLHAVWIWHVDFVWSMSSGNPNKPVKVREQKVVFMANVVL